MVGLLQLLLRIGPPGPRWRRRRRRSPPRHTSDWSARLPNRPERVNGSDSDSDSNSDSE